MQRQLRAAGESGDREALERIYERTQEEVRDGWATRLGSLEEAKEFFGGQPFREMVRFATIELVGGRGVWGRRAGERPLHVINRYATRPLRECYNERYLAPEARRKF